MKSFKKSICILALLLTLPFSGAYAVTISMDTMADQSTDQLYGTMVNESYITPYGTISFSGGGSIPYFDTYGDDDALWFHHDHAYMSSPYAEFTFDFDIDSISFLSYGMSGGIFVEAYDINNLVVDTYFTDDFMFKSPIYLSGSGIRKFTFEDGRLFGGQEEIVNLVFTTSAPISQEVVPEPSTIFLFGSSFAGFIAFRKFRKA